MQCLGGSLKFLNIVNWDFEIYMLEETVRI